MHTAPNHIVRQTGTKEFPMTKAAKSNASSSAKTAPDTTVYNERLARHSAELDWLFMELYTDRSALEDLKAAMADAYAARPDDLKDLDAKRESDPDWYKRGDMFGLTMYTDLFAGDLKKLARRIPYPKELAAYFGTPEAPECHMLYNVSIMVNLWSALASQDVRLLKTQIDKLNALPENCWFVNYLRCHDDIGWGLDEDVEKELDIDPLKHKEFLYHFYEGCVPGSWAMGELYNYDPATSDARSCGTTASLCGVEKALITHDKPMLEKSVERDLLMHRAMSFLRGFPMLNCGDEIGQLNGWDYKEDPERVADSRNLHRSKFDWGKAELREKSGTLQNQLWEGMEGLREMRDDPCFAPDAWVTTWDTHNDAVLGVVRQSGEHTLVGLFNFSDARQDVWLDGADGLMPRNGAELAPYEARLVRFHN